MKYEKPKMSVVLFEEEYILTGMSGEEGGEDGIIDYGSGTRMQTIN